MAKPCTRRQILTGAGLIGLLAACGETRIGPAPVSLVEAVSGQNTPTTIQVTTNNIEIIAKCGGELTFNFPDDEVYGVYGWKISRACPGGECYFQEPNVKDSFRKTGLPAGIIIHYKIDKAVQPPETVEGSIKIPSC